MIDNMVLGDAPHALILSLIDEFNRIWESASPIRHNLELSEFYAINLPSHTSCINCEIVLRYQNTVCIESEIDTRTKYHFVKSNSTYNIPGIKYGNIEFYIKQTDSDFVCTYVKIHIVKFVDDIHIGKWSNQKITKIKNIVDIATSRSLTDTLNATAGVGDLGINTVKNISEIITLVNTIVDESKYASIELQVSHLISQKNILDMSPDFQIGNVISNIIQSEKISSTCIMIPDFGPIILHSNSNRCVIIPIDMSIMIVPISKLKSITANHPEVLVSQITPHLHIVSLEHNPITIPKFTQTEQCKCQPTNSLLLNKLKN